MHRNALNVRKRLDECKVKKCVDLILNSKQSNKE